MGISNFINTGMQSLASWWSERQAVKSTDACIWFILGAIAGFKTQPERKPLRFPYPGSFLDDEAFKDRSSYEKAVAKADRDWAKFLKVIKDVKKKAKQIEEAKANAKRDEKMGEMMRKAKLLYGNDTVEEQQGEGLGLGLGLEQRIPECPKTV